MLCQREAVCEHPSPSTITVLPLKRSSTPERRLPPDTDPVPVDKYLDSQQHPPVVEEELNNVKRGDGNRYHGAQRDQLEKDVFGLQERLRQEMELHYALETAFRQEAAVVTKFPNLPLHAQELVADVMRLEIAISHLEGQIASLNLQLGHEQRERQKAEACCLSKLSIVAHQAPLTNSTTYTQQQQQLLTEFSPVPQVPSCPALASHTNNPILPSRSYSLLAPPQGPLNEIQDDYVNSPSSRTTCPSDEQTDFISRTENLSCKRLWQKPPFFSPEKLKPKSCDSPTAKLCGDMKRNIEEEVMDLKNSWLHPNRLSEEMVTCMVSIYQRLADPMDSNHSLKRTSSPSSPYGNTTGSSLSSFSESSFVSFAQSPPFDSQIMDIGTDRSFDPYKTHEKLPWADIGCYNTAIEVSEMMVGKEQLDYAAEALRVFRSLVEHLSRVDPSSMKHNEKLAFWINIYNALMMHAYLAYGVPKNDFKFFSLMQKAAYTVGGHSFNAVVIEHLLLKAKAQWYRPQIALLLAHQKLKLRDEVSMFAIDYVEPLVTFSLSFGASSSPAVRVYTAENVHNEMQSALQDYARASVGVSMRGKLLIPKLLFDFACDLVDESEIPEWICQFLPCQQSSVIKNCIKHRQQRFLNSKHFSVVPFDFQFRYLFIPKQNQSSHHGK